MAPYSGDDRVGRRGRPSARARPARPTGKAATPMRTLHQIAARLEATEPSRALIDRCLERIRDPAGEGSRTFLKVYGEAARAAADAYDVMRRSGGTPSLFAGIPVSIKDL